jgi:hypothetical protein
MPGKLRLTWLGQFAVATKLLGERDVGRDGWLVYQGVEKREINRLIVISAQAGIQFAALNKIIWLWIPACAGMTVLF